AYSLYSQVAKEYPQSKDIPWSLYQIGNCYYHLGLFEKAKTAYEKLIKDFSGSFWSEMAKVMI
ncbi:tetratricopeptide repeat protein, partial [Candidatus Aerophobetes bacterium]|nr:tetratricopeptide repeat protein [Candidatus Aerophobetes bacterium]